MLLLHWPTNPPSCPDSGKERAYDGEARVIHRTSDVEVNVDRYSRNGRQRPAILGQPCVGESATYRFSHRRADDLEGNKAAVPRRDTSMLTGRRLGPRPVLVVGVPRSGTTWTANVLGASEGASVVMEPDNEKLSAPAIWAKAGLGRFPVLGAGDNARRYARLWRWALSGAGSNRRLRLAQRLVRHATGEDLEALVQGREPMALRMSGILGSYPHAAPATGVVIAKSVHACLAIEWLAARFDVDVLIVLRHPANVLASWLELELPDRDRDLGSLIEIQEKYSKPWGVPVVGHRVLDRAVWQVGLLTCALEDALSRHPEWHVRTHEQLCSNSQAQFQSLAADLGLTLGDAAIDLLRRSDKAGSGFAVKREASGLADSWRHRLGEQEVETLKRVLRTFPLRTWDITDQ